MVDVVECVRADVVNLVDTEETYNEEYEVDLLGNLFQHLFPSLIPRSTFITMSDQGEKILSCNPHYSLFHFSFFSDILKRSHNDVLYLLPPHFYSHL